MMVNLKKICFKILYNNPGRLGIFLSNGIFHSKYNIRLHGLCSTSGFVNVCAPTHTFEEIHILHAVVIFSNLFVSKIIIDGQTEAEQDFQGFHLRYIQDVCGDNTKN
jgi:hypothetical protein